AGLWRDGQEIDGVANRRIDRQGGAELPGGEQPIEGAEYAVGVVGLAPDARQEPERPVEHLEGRKADARGVGDVTTLDEALVVAGTRAPDPIKGLATAAGEHVDVGKYRAGGGLIGRERYGGRSRCRSVGDARAVITEGLRKAAAHLPPEGVRAGV